MDVFKIDFDVFCTTDGKAQDRLPSDISQMAIQEGTVLNAEMVNAWTFEIYNLIESLGLKPDSTKNNQLSLAINKRTVYDQVGKVNSWLCPRDQIPKTEAVLDGSTLYSSNYEDGLAELKKRCPSWVSGDNISLPSLNGYFPRFDSSRTLGRTQDDAMQKVTVDIGHKFRTPKDSGITIPGEVFGYTHSKTAPKFPAGSDKIAQIFNPAGLHRTHTFDLVQRTSRTINLSSDIKLDLDVNLTQEGTEASENRPKNFGVLMSVVVGIPKIVEEKNGQV